MVLIDGVKFACQSCIKGHRSTKCTHTTRPLVEIKKKGRPTSQCSHCRDLRRTRSVHGRCDCAARDLEERPKAVILPNGIADVVKLQTPPTVDSPAPDTAAAKGLRVNQLLNPCNCRRGGKCNCCSTVSRAKPGSPTNTPALSDSSTPSPAASCCSNTVETVPASPSFALPQQQPMPMPPPPLPQMPIPQPPSYFYPGYPLPPDPYQPVGSPSYVPLANTSYFPISNPYASPFLSLAFAPSPPSFPQPSSCCSTPAISSPPAPVASTSGCCGGSTSQPSTLPDFGVTSPVAEAFQHQHQQLPLSLNTDLSGYAAAYPAAPSPIYNSVPPMYSSFQSPLTSPALFSPSFAPTNPLFLPQTQGTMSCFCGDSCQCVGCPQHDPMSRKRPGVGGNQCVCATDNDTAAAPAKRACCRGDLVLPTGVSSIEDIFHSVLEGEPTVSLPQLWGTGVGAGALPGDTGLGIAPQSTVPSLSLADIWGGVPSMMSGSAQVMASGYSFIKQEVETPRPWVAPDQEIKRKSRSSRKQSSRSRGPSTSRTPIATPTVSWPEAPLDLYSTPLDGSLDCGNNVFNGEPLEPGCGDACTCSADCGCRGGPNQHGVDPSPSMPMPDTVNAPLKRKSGSIRKTAASTPITTASPPSLEKLGEFDFLNTDPIGLASFSPPNISSPKTTVVPTIDFAELVAAGFS